ncbi:MAG: AMP-binding protein [Verrucomicrobiota bacterium]
MKSINETLYDHFRKLFEIESKSKQEAFLVYNSNYSEGEWEKQYDVFTYSDLYERVMIISQHMREKKLHGQILIAQDTGIEFVASFLACLFTGRIAVPIPKPKMAKEGQRWVHVAKDAGAVAVLSDMKAQQFFRPLNGLECICTAELTEKAEMNLERPRLEDVAFLQYTSGSTGLPKGVMVTHANIMHNLSAIQQRFGHTEDSKGVIWLPPHHDMGLIGGILQPIFVGFPVVLMSASTIVRAPYKWLEAIHQFKATTSGGPAFAYQLAAQRITPENKQLLDLSSWELAFVGAETVRANVLQEFATAFVECGFNPKAFLPCYGMAEATLMVSAPEKGTGWRLAQAKQAGEVPRVSCGHVSEGIQVLIVDSDNKIEKENGEIGEIWVSGSSVARGYWNNEQATQDIFRASLFSSLSSENYLRTGDLGFLDQNELVICGRLKDLIVIHGQNYIPTDLEESAAKAIGLNASSIVAFAIENGIEEQVVMVYEMRPSQRNGRSWEEISMNVYDCILSEWALAIAYCIAVNPVSLPRTTSGKLQRRQCCQNFQEKRLSTLFEQSFLGDDTAGDLLDLPQDQESFNHFVCDQFARVLGLSGSQLDHRKGFFEMGLTSVTGMELKARLERSLKMELPATLIIDYPNLETLLLYLGNQLFDKREKSENYFEVVDKQLDELEALLDDS